MGKYIDLCTVIDVEPEVSQVLGLIEDLLSEFWQRMDEDFFRVFVEDYCKDSDIRQGYVGTSSNGEARVSIRDEKAWVIIKSNGCLARLEYEIPIPKKDADNPYMYIETLEGTMKASVGDYIIKGVNGEFYPCKPDIFEKTYEEVAE